MDQRPKQNLFLEIERLHQLEKSYVLLLNAFDGWDLEWCGGGYDHYDAKGKTPKGTECVIEFKFRNKYYQTKMLEVFKYEKLMAMPKKWLRSTTSTMRRVLICIGLNNLIRFQSRLICYCPKTTVWQNNKVNKSVYLLEESQAATISYI
jgi:hypothetical protein